MNSYKNKKLSINNIVDKKFSEKITMITAYDALFASIFDGEVDMILVGDSLNMSFNAQNDTLNISLDEMIYHVKAVCKGAPNTFIVADMPFGTYTDKKSALKNAIKIYQQTSVDAVKFEGGEDKKDIVKYLTSNGIAVVGHIGLLPQSVRYEGGYKIKGDTKDQKEQLLIDAKALEEAGAFCAVIEGVKSDVAQYVAKNVNIPLIGIGAGNGVDGQVLVWSDAFGFFDKFKPKFVKRYLDGASLVRGALQKYVQEVKTKEFPKEENSY